MAEQGEPRCQYIMYHKRVELPSMKPIDPPIPVVCGLTENSNYGFPWGHGPLGHTFTRVGQHYYERYSI